MNEFTISVIIAERPYRLTIKHEEEETIRKAAKEINKTIKHYSENFAFKDKQDLLAMVALEKTSEALKRKNELIESDENITIELEEIDKILSDSLSKD
ncbi:MAG: hypothetical protein B6D61_11675 [Bacteroidetes bacterium 4484_249]|nr:MAG: hypothetical protein B6D61_11675 [Bacteroidetes bacterium 4484_249]